MAKKSAAVLGLYVAIVNKDSWFHVNGVPVTIGPTAQELARGIAKPDVLSDTIRNCSGDYGEMQNGLHLDGLAATSQGNNRDSGEERRLYGYEVRYQDVYAVDLHRATQMYRTLASIDRRMKAYAAQHGHPVTYGQYLLQVAKAAGLTQMVFPQRGSERFSSYRDQELRYESLADGARTVDYMVEQWVRAGQQGAPTAMQVLGG